MTRKLEEIARRFWQKVQIGADSECWPWTASKNSRGYGSINIGGRTEKSHRIAWRLANDGDQIPNGKFVCHSCDNPSCCNPSHLWVGTPQDNVTDMMAKGRHVRLPRDESKVAYKFGEEAGSAKLKQDDVLAIRARRKNGERLSAIADDYGVHFSLISLIARRKSWRHLP